jgi:hypothetical protein
MTLISNVQDRLTSAKANPEQLALFNDLKQQYMFSGQQRIFSFPVIDIDSPEIQYCIANLLHILPKGQLHRYNLTIFHQIFCNATANAFVDCVYQELKTPAQPKSFLEYLLQNRDESVEKRIFGHFDNTFPWILIAHSNNLRDETNLLIENNLLNHNNFFTLLTIPFIKHITLCKLLTFAPPLDQAKFDFITSLCRDPKDISSAVVDGVETLRLYGSLRTFDNLQVLVNVASKETENRYSYDILKMSLSDKINQKNLDLLNLSYKVAATETPDASDIALLKVQETNLQSLAAIDVAYCKRALEKLNAFESQTRMAPQHH